MKKLIILVGLLFLVSCASGGGGKRGGLDDLGYDMFQGN